MRFPRSARALLIALGTFALALGAVFQWRATSHEGALRSDEPEWIAISILHWRQFALGKAPAGAELDPPEERHGTPWRRGVQHTTFGYMNPCLPKLVWGAVLHGAGHRKASAEAFTVFTRDDPARMQAAQDELLGAMRVTRGVVLLLCAAGTALFVLAAGQMRGGVRGWLLASLTGVLFVASPVVRDTATYIRTDWFMVVPGLAAFLFALLWRRALGGGAGRLRQLLLAALLGLLSGMSVSSKLSGAMVGICVALWALLAWFERCEVCDTREFLLGPVCSSLLAGLVCALVFFALNPRLWSEPLVGVQDILARWDKLLTYFQDVLAPRTGVRVARSLPERLSLFLDRSAGSHDPWRALTGLGGGWLLTLLGLGVLGWRARALGKGRDDALPAALALAFCCVTLLGTALWIPLDWERFFLTAAAPMALAQACALLFLGEAGVHALRGQRAAVPGAGAA